jgi:hypothetical protein
MWHDKLQTGVEGICCVGSYWGTINEGSSIIQLTRYLSKRAIMEQRRMGLEQGEVPLVGLTNIATLLSACFSVTNSPARSKCGLIFSYSQRWGTAVGFGRGGLSLLIWAQSGLVYSDSRLERSESVGELVDPGLIE